MKTATFLIITAAFFATSAVAFAGDAAESSAPLNNQGTQIHFAPATHKPAAASGVTGSVIGNNELRKTPQQRVAPPPLPITKPVLPANAGQRHGVAIISGAAVKTSHENGVINGTERRRSP